MTAWAVLFVYAYPGLMTEASVELLLAARAGTYHAATSPALAALVQASEWIIGGQFGLLVLQSGALLGGLYLLARNRLASRAAAWTAAAIFVFPPVLLPMAVLSETSMMAGLAMLGLGGLLSSARSARVSGLVALGAATALQPSAAVATLPIIALLFERSSATPAVRRYLVAIAVWLAVTLAGLGVSARLAAAGRDAAEATRPAATVPAGLPALERGAPPDRARLAEALPDRLEVTWALLTAPSDAVAPRRDLPAALGIHHRWSVTQRAMTQVMRALDAVTPLFSPWLYVLLTIAWVVLARRDRRLLALLASGLGYGVAQVIAGRGANYALAHWMVVASVAAGGVWSAQRSGRGRAPEMPAAEPGRDVVARPPRSRLASWATRARSLPPSIILGVGWVGLMLYAYPGYMSYDSVRQLGEARSGVFSDAHPPAMAALWQVVDWVVTGSFGMLILQAWAFLTGSYLVARRFTSPRAAAVVAVALCWFPPVSSVLGAIWKDSQMCAFLMLGTGLVLSPRRGVRLSGLLSLALATAMRHNALTMSLPIVVLLFEWSPALRGWRRYAVAVVAWLAVTFAAHAATRALTVKHEDLWHEALALYDIVGTMHYLPPTSDERLREMLVGTPLTSEQNLQQQIELDESGDYLGSVGTSVQRLFRTPNTTAQRAAVGRAWRTIVLGHPLAFLRYRWSATTQLLQLSGPPTRYPIYIWFTDANDEARSARQVEQYATASAVQRWLQRRLTKICRSWVALVYLHLLLAVGLLPWCWRTPVWRALLLSALISEAAIALVFPSPDTRYSVWLTITAVMSLALLIARRLSPPANAPPAAG